MSLRARFRALFAVLAVVPLMAVGIFDCVHSMRALENLVAEQVEQIPTGPSAVYRNGPTAFCPGQAPT